MADTLPTPPDPLSSRYRYPQYLPLRDRTLLERILANVEGTDPLFPWAEGADLLYPGAQWHQSLGGISHPSDGLSALFVAVDSRQLDIRFTYRAWQSGPRRLRLT